MLSAMLPIEPRDSSGTFLEVALDFARRHCRYLQGTCLRPDTSAAVMAAAGMAAPVLIDDLERDTWDRIGEAKEVFERAVLSSGMGDTLAEFHADIRPGAAGLAEHARLFDLTLVAQPRPGDPGARRTILESVLFEGGRAVLLIPPTAAPAAIETVLVAWNGSAETARALASARPLLDAARRVVVVSTEGAMVSGPSSAEVAAMLRRVGVRAEARERVDGPSPGEAFLQACRDLGAELMVKGAYTQSRLRQMIFGGATSHIIEKAHLPVLLAH